MHLQGSEDNIQIVGPLYVNQPIEKEGSKIAKVALILAKSWERGIAGFFLKNGFISQYEVTFLISSLQQHLGESYFIFL